MDNDKKTLELEGFGELKGQTMTANLIKKTPTIAIAEVQRGDQKRQIKFGLHDGLALGGDAKNGFRLSDAALKDLRPATNGKTKKEKKDSDKPASTRVISEDPNPSQDCKCGCGGKTAKRRNFIQGHDAKAHSMVKRFLRGQDPEEALQKASPYVREHVVAEGGWNSQPMPEKKAATSPDGKVITNAEGKKLTGAAAAAKAKALAKAAEEAESSGDKAAQTKAETDKLPA